MNSRSKIAIHTAFSKELFAKVLPDFVRKYIWQKHFRKVKKVAR